MSHDRLWAPWRLGYIQGTEPPAAAEREIAWLPGAEPNCFLCRGAADRDDRANLVVARGEHTLVVLNRYPYNNGHLLVAPLVHLPGSAISRATYRGKLWKYSLATPTCSSG